VIDPTRCKGYSPQQLREQIHDMKADFKKKDLPFGIDLLIPAVGGCVLVNPTSLRAEFASGLLGLVNTCPIRAPLRLV
jgi:NAD(P)H-dependent flavin oxidoreductase YrpB (nitropropane dioxygenase family)